MLQLLLGLPSKVPGRVLERGVCLLVKIVVFVLVVEQWMSSLASQRHSVVPESLPNQPADCVSWDTNGGELRKYSVYYCRVFTILSPLIWSYIN